MTVNTELVSETPQEVKEEKGWLENFTASEKIRQFCICNEEFKINLKHVMYGGVNVLLMIYLRQT